VTAFDRATAIEQVAPGRFRAHCDTSWSAPRGPNGGYLAAIVLRAMQAAVGDPERAPRSLTLHYLRPPGNGFVDLDVVIEREGRSLSSLSARLSQDGRLCVVALGALGTDFPGVATYADRAPTVPPPDALERVEPHPEMPPIGHRFDVRYALGPTLFSAATEARTGGWLAFDEPRPVDAAALAIYADAWMPAPFSRLDRPVPAPTIDLTIHFRHRVPLPDDDGSGRVVIDVRSRFAAEGYFEEDAEIWSPSGILLAHSRQLALLVPPSRP
jgi:acyl-CoA thioesterase